MEGVMHGFRSLVTEPKISSDKSYSPANNHNFSSDQAEVLVCRTDRPRRGEHQSGDAGNKGGAVFDITGEDEMKSLKKGLQWI
ncbi:hypothetical protein Syun_023246 [Stephania yunnanensis]|uniref:Uncharacterized protein n=1 Tax=Stephania yunnanensis TaxID=152371 RepID=A0AAP0I3C9_9MAGN